MASVVAIDEPNAEWVESSMSFVAGVNGCKGAWVAALHSLATRTTTFRVVPTVTELLSLPETPVVIAVDVPIGLLERAVAGGRSCEIAARKLLGRPRASSVFGAPVRGSLAGTMFTEAGALNRASSPAGIGISQQAFGLFHKLRDIDACVTPQAQDRIFEVHPELCFYEMSGGSPAQHSKKSKAGRRERKEMLSQAGFPDVPRLGKGVAEDDLLDAMAACWTALRIHRGTAIRIPDPPPQDARGLRMELWR